MNAKQIWLVTRTAGTKAIYLAKKYKPEILMVLSAVSGVACVLNVRKAAKKEQAILDQHAQNIIEAHNIVDNDPNLTEKQGKRIIRRVYVSTGAQLCKLYGPAVAFGIASGTFSALGFFIQRNRTKNAVAALATAVAAQKKLMEEGKLPELPSLDVTDSSKEGESSDTKEQKGSPPLKKNFQIFFGPGSLLWKDKYALEAGRGPMMIGDLQAMQIYLNSLLQTKVKDYISVNDLAYCLYEDKSIRDTCVRIEDMQPNVPITWNPAEGQMYGFKADPDNRFIDMYSIGNFSTDMMLSLMERDGGVWLTISAEYIGSDILKPKGGDKK
jgi:hypothetical protein